MQAPAVGEVIADKYRIERILGQGGMGVVLAATHLQLGHEVAIKCLLPEASQQPEALARFVQEARTCARMRSDHIVRVYDVGTQPNGAPFLVMELLEGLDLAEHLRRRGPLPINEVVGYLRDVCEGLAVAHAAGIVHRDLKPSNLFVVPRPSGGRGTVKILDFGIAKLLALPPTTAEGLGHTASGGLLGSPYYMAPEQILDPRSVTGQTDLWSLGVVLLELCSGERPFVADTAPALLGKILSEPAPTLRARRPDAPAWLEAIAVSCLQKDPTRRPASAAALARELVGASDPFGATALGSSGRSSGGWPVPVASPSSEPGSGGSSGHHPVAVAVAPPAQPEVPYGRGSGVVPGGPSGLGSGPWLAGPLVGGRPGGAGDESPGGRSDGAPRRVGEATTQPEAGRVGGDRSVVAVVATPGGGPAAPGRRRLLGLGATVGLGAGLALWQRRPRAVLVRGSTTLGQQLQTHWRGLLEAQGLRVEVASSGTTRGLEALLQEGTGLAAASRRPTEEEQRRAGGRLREYTVGYDAIAIVTHVDNAVPWLSVAQLRTLFAGEARDWAAMGGQPGPVHLVMRPEELGGHEALRALLGDVHFAEGAEMLRSNDELVQRLKFDRGAVSFASFTVGGPLRQVPVGRSHEGPFLAPSTATVRQGTYPLVRPLAFYSLGHPTTAEARFLEVVRGGAAQDALLAAGFVPLR